MGTRGSSSHGGGGGGSGPYQIDNTVNGTSLSKGYKKRLNDLFNAADESIKKLYETFVPRTGVVTNMQFKGDGHYRPTSNDIELNATGDNTGVMRIHGVVWFHEHGHYLDAALGHASADQAFYNALKNDVKNYETHWVSLDPARKALTAAQRRQAIGTEMVQELHKHTHAIQDLYGGVYKEYNYNSAGATTWFGHSWSYWHDPARKAANGGAEVLATEAFAHFVGASFVRENQPYIQKYFPTAWSWFSTYIDERAKKI